MRTLIAILLLCNVSIAQDKPTFDGVCRMTDGKGKQWSGVAISTTEILSVAHHDEPVDATVYAEFPLEQHTSPTRLRIPAKVKRIAKRADLSLIEYKCPDFAAVRVYPVRPVTFTQATIRGYVGEGVQIREDVPVIARDRVVDGYKVLTVRSNAISGMSGSGVLLNGGTVGILFGGNREITDCVTVGTIEQFLGGSL
jgi:hypothetical protein